MSSSKSKTNLFLNNKRALNMSTNDSNQELNKGPWTNKEDQLLKEWVQKNGPCNWTKCSEFIKGRSGKQCREHWNNSLDPNLTKGQWKSEEDLLIMIFYEKYGGSWKKIIPIFPSRTENSIKNRFFSQLRKLASKVQQKGKKEYSSKFGLELLKKFLPQATELAKQKYFEETKTNDKELEQYVNKIDNLVKNRKKGIKFIDFDTLKNNKKNMNIIDIKENNEEDIYNNEANLATPSKNKKRKGKKKLQESIKKEKIIDLDSDKDETINKEGLITYDETINSINSKKIKEINNDDENINKSIKRKKSKNKNLFISEHENKEMINKNKDNFLPPINNNNSNKINYKRLIENNVKKENIEDKFHDYKIEKNIKEDDIDSKGSIEEIDKHIGNKQYENVVDKDTANWYKFFRNRINKRENSRLIENNIEKGKLLNPCISFENNDLNYKTNWFRRIKSKNINEEKFDKKISFNKEFKGLPNPFGALPDYKSKVSFNLYQPFPRVISSKILD